MFNDQRIIDLLQDKKVCLVGPASFLVGKNLGKIFDEYDLIVRANDVFPRFYTQDYGSRTDVILYTFPTFAMQEIDMKFRMNMDTLRKVKMVVCPTIKADHQWKDNVEDNVKSVRFIEFPYHCINKEEYYYIQNYFQCEPNTGMVSLLLLLKYKVKEVLMSGFTFYHNVGIADYDNAYYPGYVIYKIPTWNPKAGHNQPKQIEIFKEKILKEFNGIVKIDSYLKKLLNLNYSNVLDIGE